MNRNFAFCGCLVRHYDLVPNEIGMLQNGLIPNLHNFHTSSPSLKNNTFASTRR